MKRILGLGNALVDVLAKTDSDALLSELDLPRGSMQLIDEQRMQGIWHAMKQHAYCMVAGGSASNTIAGLSELGVSTGFVGKVGRDALGEFYETDLREHGVQSRLLFSDTPTGRCHVFVSADGERTMATYLGAAVELISRELTADVFHGFDVLHIEGYLVQNKELLLRAAQLAKGLGMEISLDLASYNIVAENLEFLTDYVQRYVDIVFANELEARAFSDRVDGDAAAYIASMSNVAVVKVGSRGSFVQRGNMLLVIAPEQVDSVDSTGAGDLYAAGFLYGYASNLSLSSCGKIGSYCAAQVIQGVGAKMSEERWRDIKHYIAEML